MATQAPSTWKYPRTSRWNHVAQDRRFHSGERCGGYTHIIFFFWLIPSQRSSISPKLSWIGFFLSWTLLVLSWIFVSWILKCILDKCGIHDDFYFVIHFWLIQDIFNLDCKISIFVTKILDRTPKSKCGDKKIERIDQDTSCQRMKKLSWSIILDFHGISMIIHATIGWFMNCVRDFAENCQECKLFEITLSWFREFRLDLCVPG